MLSDIHLYLLLQFTTVPLSKLSWLISPHLNALGVDYPLSYNTITISIANIFDKIIFLGGCEEGNFKAA